MRRSVCVGVVVIGGLLACGDEMTDSAGDALRKAGRVLGDAGDVLADAGSDASAQEDAGQGAPAAETYELACDQMSESVTTDRMTRVVTTRTERFAILSIETANLIGADVRRCGRERYGRTQFAPCTALDTSTYLRTCQNAELARPADCELGAPAWIDPGRVRVSCGSRVREVHPEPYSESSKDEGELFGTVTLTVRRRQ